MKKKIIIICTLIIIILIAVIIFVFNKKNNDEVYTIGLRLVDDKSPARYLDVYKNGEKIEFLEVRYLDDVVLCKGTNPTIHFTELDGETELKVILKNGKEVFAKIEKGDKK